MNQKPGTYIKSLQLRFKKPFLSFLVSKHFLTLSGGAPACDGALPEERQWSHPDVDGSDELVEDQRLLQL